MNVLYRAMSGPSLLGDVGLNLSTIARAVSKDGRHFKDRQQFILPEKDWEKYGCEDPRVTYFEGKYYVFYTALSTFPFSANGIKVGLAVSKDLKTVEEKHLITPFNAKAMMLFPERVHGTIATMLTVNPDLPPSKIAFAFFDSFEEMYLTDKWNRFYDKLDEHVINLARGRNDHAEIGAVPIKTEAGWLLIYAHIQNYFTHDEKIFGIEAVLLDKHNPMQILGRTEYPLMVPEEIYEKFGHERNIIFPSGAQVYGDVLYIYYGGADTVCARAKVSLRDLLKVLTPGIKDRRVVRFEGNPILKPKTENDWENKAVFNPAAIELNKTVYLFYRAMGADNTSVIGCAKSKDGFKIDERLAVPIYVPRADFEMKKVPGGNSGCEDPRVTFFNGRIYMCYTAYNGIEPPRVAITSIKEKDFLAKRFNWEWPVLITPDRVDDKDTCLFPEKIKGKYFLLHRVSHHICGDYVSSLDFQKEKIDSCLQLLGPRKGMWDSKKVGIAGPPFKTKKGWVLLYHGISENGFYHTGAALLDLKEPTKILARTVAPILSPETDYEKVGQVGNVVFPCGTVIRRGTIYIYYGGADSVIAVATLKMKDLLDMLTIK